MDFRHTGKEKQQIQLFPSNQNLLEMPGGPILIKQGNKETTEKIVKILKNEIYTTLHLFGDNFFFICWLL